MKLTVENVKENISKVKLDKVLTDEWKDVEGFLDLMEYDEDIKKATLNWLDRANAYLEEQESKKSDKPEVSDTKPKKEKQKKESKPKKEDKETSLSDVKAKKVDYTIENLKVASLNKNSIIEEYEEECNRPEYEDKRSNWSIQNWVVSYELKLTQKQYDILKHSLLDEYPFFAGHGGTKEILNEQEAERVGLKNHERYMTVDCIAVYVGSKLMFVADPEGFDYARYVALPTDRTVIRKKLAEEKAVAYYKDQILGESKTKNKKPTKAELKQQQYDNATKVEMIPVEISIIKRYIGMNGKTLKEVKSSKNNNPNTLLNALQKSIVERKIRKESEWKEEIMNIQKSLVKIVNGIEEGLYGNSNVITINHYDELKKIVDSYVVDNYTTVAKTFISTVQEKSDKKKAENLLKRVENVTTDDAHQDELEAMKKSLKDFVDGKTEKVETTERQLRGLYGSMNGDGGKCVNGLGNVADDNGVIASTDLVKADFDAIGFTGRWASFFGRPSSNFKFMVYGSAGSGKSTFCLQLAKYLSNDLGKKVLYVASEEKFGYTLKEKIERLNVANSNFYIAESIPLDLSSFDVIFFDSVNDLQIEADELEEISKGKATVSIFQCTKDGVYKGGQAFAHNADAVIKVDNMMATSEKNRFGEGGKEFQVI